ncbi:MAG: GNAT family N-acetyltransferase [Desulfovibrionaceae bacterium]|nr:GNAT family N-acetyltransferase [Desulfovibrionaceae bacterium]
MSTRESGGAAVREVRIVSGIAPEDVEVVLEMAASSGLFTPDAMLSAEDMAWDSAYGNGSEDHSFLLARAGEGGVDRVVGFLCFGPIPHWPEDYELYGIAVDPEYRRLGVGTGLVAEMRRRVADRQGKRVFLETGADEAYEGAHCFYEVSGFECEHRFRKQFIPVDGGMVYRLDVSVDENDRNYQ